MLGVSSTASRSEITKAYHKLAARYHPDKHQGNDLEELAREKLVQLNAAHDVLSDPGKRSAYDAARIGRFPGAPPAGAPGGGAASPTTRRGLFSTVRGIFVIVLIFAALPYIFRVIRSPKVLVVIAIAIALAWFGPRIVRYFKK